jgi:hypothetical protein
MLLGHRVQALKQQLSPVQQYVQAQLGKLRSGSPAEKAEALKGLGKPCLSNSKWSQPSHSSDHCMQQSASRTSPELQQLALLQGAWVNL